MKKDKEFALELNNNGTGFLVRNNGEKYKIVKTNIYCLILFLEIPVQGIIDGQVKNCLLKGVVSFSGKPLDGFKVIIDGSEETIIYGKSINELKKIAIDYIDSKFVSSEHILHYM